jgi:copper chaperone
MTTETLFVANLKCGGCATTIKKNLLALVGVKQVEVDIDNDNILITYEQNTHDAIAKRLLDMGYPEATEKNGLLLQLKSYASCLAGKVNNQLAKDTTN